MRIVAVSAALCCAIVGLATAADVSAAIKKPTSIPAQGLEPALNVFAKERNLQVVYRSEVVGSLRTDGAAGELTANEALKQLLSGTGLTFQYLDDKTVTIVPASTVTPAAGTAGSSANFHSEAGGLFRVAQAEQSSPSQADESKVSSADAGSKSIAEVVVTGSHIRGVEPVGAKVIVIDREYIENSGQSTLQDVLNTLPQLAPGPREVVPNGGDQRIQENQYGLASGVNIHGLGAADTLVLVDGRRQAVSGNDGAFVDIANIPLAAVERVEILADGASAIYGSDAIAGVVNIILRKNFSGSQSRIHFSTKRGDGNEVGASHLLGTGWGSGTIILGIDYLKRDPLLATDRSYAVSGDHSLRGGGNINFITANPGNIVDNNFVPVFAIPRGQNGQNLLPSQLIAVLPDRSNANYQNAYEGNGLFPDSHSESVFASVTQKLSDKMELSASARFNNRPVDSSSASFALGSYLSLTPRNPFYVDAFGDQRSYTLAYDFRDDFTIRVQGETKTYDGSIGIAVDLNGSWKLGSTLSYSRQTMSTTAGRGTDFTVLDEALGNYLDPNNPGAIDNPATSYNPLVDGFFNPYGDGSNTNRAVLAAIRSVPLTVRSDWRTYDGNMILDGPLFSMTGGKAHLATGVAYKREVRGAYRASNGIELEEVAQSSKAVFAELTLPLVGEANAMPGIRKLRLSLAERYEEFGQAGNTLNPKMGLAWEPYASMSLRGSWGRSFKIPTVIQNDKTLHKTGVFGGSLVIDPSVGGLSRVITLSGVSPDLHEETANSWTAGMDFHPAAIPGLQVSATYYDTKFKDKIDAVSFAARDILANTAVYQDIIDRNVTAEEVIALCASASPVNRTDRCDDPAFPATVDVIIDRRIRNISLQRNSGVDLVVEKLFRTDKGELKFGLSGNYTLKNETRLVEGGVKVNLLDMVYQPLRLRTRASASWQRGPLNVYGAINHVPSYTNPYGGENFDQSQRIDAWTTVDLGLSHTLSTTVKGLKGVRWNLTLVNILDKDPPFVANGVSGFDPSNADPYGRFISARISKDW